MNNNKNNLNNKKTSSPTRQVRDSTAEINKRPGNKLGPNSQSAKRAPENAAGKKPVANSDGLNIVSNRMDFFNTSSRKLMLAAGISILGVFVQSAIAYMGYTAKNERVYFATDPNGSLIKLVVLSEPNQKNEVVSQWVQKAMVDTFSLNFTNINERLNESTMRWFTRSGASSFINEIASSGYIDSVRNEKLIMSMAFEHTPILIREGRNPRTGIYTWQFQGDAILTFRTQSQQFTRSIRLTTTIERVSVLESVDGIGVSHIVLTNRR